MFVRFVLLAIIATDESNNNRNQVQQMLTMLENVFELMATFFHIKASIRERFNASSKSR